MIWVKLPRLRVKFPLFPGRTLPQLSILFVPVNGMVFETFNKTSLLIRNPFFLLPAFTILLLTSCEEKKQESTSYYYPQKNVYFDPASHKYYFSLNGGKTWDSMFAKTEKPAALGPRIILEGVARDLVQNNNSHRAEYNGSLIDIPSGDTSLIAMANTVSERKPLYKPPVKKVEVKKDKRSFFQRLFGKKKK